MNATYTFDQIKKDLIEISCSKPIFQCKNCQLNIPEKFLFRLENNTIISSYKCFCSQENFNFSIHEMYNSKNTFKKIPIDRKLPSAKKSFTSIQSLFDFVQNKIMKNIEYKDKIIDRINRTSYLNTINKVKLSNKVIDGLNKNIEINIEFYKILHFLTYNNTLL